ncbi:ATP-dependent zinc metalloprotease YME1-like [Tropilaelaps mercedesae]|uniref:ATP-dependent zinc metalloprotease YME1-like n=1 Tax=Tropilaelaps mercedesae TaxID=418985 RepID=A0A1V9Y0P7_9ACAR|nr:ATP-dependent zinc metalloprotease YME1-like [Tropilaelaps mercedesae]
MFAVFQPSSVPSLASLSAVGRAPGRTNRASTRTVISDLQVTSFQNTFLWFSKSQLFSSLLKNKDFQRALFYTPAVKEEVTIQNSCVWPTNYESENRNRFSLYRSSLLRSPLEKINFGFVPMRGFKTKASIAREGYGAGLSSTADVLRSLRKDDHTKKNDRVDKIKHMRTYLEDSSLSPDEQSRLRIAFAEGYVAGDRKPKSGKLKILTMFRDILGMALIVAVLFMFIGGPIRRVIIGTSNEVLPEEIDVSFKDVRGAKEAKQELQEIVEFLRNPGKFSLLGGKLPKGVLLVGPPGTGKTLLARAVAGEAGVPFFHAAGPEFDELLVGQGARRVRDLFQTAKARAPCVIFIDEIDSVGAKRTNSVLHPYANQTINQLLTEMDGFRQNEGVIVLGATNRRDDLDKALLRPGRFDVEVQVQTPDLEGRKDILEHYLAKVTLGKDISIDYLARGTTGFTGADLENLVNQAALRAAMDGKDSVTMQYFENARDKVLMGPERRSRIPDEEANLITAYHEGGHALVSFYSKHHSPLHKVTIIPRGPSLGHTAYIPEKEQYHETKVQLLATLDTLMGGRAAEELIFGPDKVTSGASSDLQRATLIAKKMVKMWGMSESVGVRTFPENQDSLVVVNDLANTTAEVIDQEIKRILNESMERAKHILKTHQRELKLLAEALMKHETLDAKEVKLLLEKGEFKR